MCAAVAPRERSSGCAASSSGAPACAAGGVATRSRRETAPASAASQHALLAQIAEQLRQQTDELRRIRRHARSCDRQLLGVQQALQQLLQLARNVAASVGLLAAAAAAALHAASCAQLAGRLRATLSSSRLLMLLAMLALAVCGARSALLRQCHKPSSWRALALARSALDSWARKQGSSREGWLAQGSCGLRFAGRFAAGLLILAAWCRHAWTQQQRWAGGALGTPGTAQAAPDPLLALLLAAAPASTEGSGHRLQVLSALLQAALYEGAVGAAAVALLGGRWLLWLLLWLLWLAWCGRSCLAAADQLAAGNSRPDSTARRAFLAAAHLVVPLLLAAVAVWR